MSLPRGCRRSQGLTSKSLSSLPWSLLSAGFLWCQIARARSIKYFECFCIPLQVVSIRKIIPGIAQLIQYRNGFFSKMTRFLQKQKKNPVLVSKTVITLTRSNKYLISKQKPWPSFYHPRYRDLKREPFWTGFSVLRLLKNINDCQVETV